jgi:hypothetical protein
VLPVCLKNRPDCRGGIGLAAWFGCSLFAGLLACVDGMAHPFSPLSLFLKVLSMPPDPLEKDNTLWLYSLSNQKPDTQR